MVEAFHYFDLAEELLQAALVELGFVDDFDGHLFADELVLGEFDFGEVALADGFDETVFADVRVVGVSSSVVGAPG